MKKELQSPKGTEALCKNLAETRFEDLSEENLDLFKDRLLDMTGCIFGGTLVEEDRFLLERFLDWGGKAEAPLLARSGKLPLPIASMLNCITARANDYGNMFTHVRGDHIASHCGETLIPMGLTLASVFPVSGKEFTAHNVASEDLIARLLYTLPDRWPVDMLLVATAAAALASRYYGLDAEQTRTALGYGAANASDPANAYFDYSQEYKFHNGAAAFMGVMAAEFARGGWRGYADPFYGHWGLICMQLPTKDGSVMPALYEDAFEDLGQTYYTEGSFKRGPGGLPTSAAAACGLELHRQIVEHYGALDPAQIRSVRVERSRSVPLNYYSEPFVLRNHTNALFSFQFAACCALLKGSRSVADVQTRAILETPYLVELTEASEMGVYDSPDGAKTMRLTVEMRDGRVFQTEKPYAASMHARLTKDELHAKFWEQFNAFGLLPRATGEEIIRLAARLEEIADMREYTALLCL